MASSPARRDAALSGPPAFRDRAEAGVMLGAALREILGEGQSRDPERERASAGLPAITPGPSANPPVVLAIPRGGVAVAVGVARALCAPLDVLMVRKIGHPAAPELGLGAIAEDGAGGAAEPYFDAEMLSRAGLTADDLAGVVARERAELARRVAVYTHRSASAEREPKHAPLSGRRSDDRGTRAPASRRRARETLRARKALFWRGGWSSSWTTGWRPG